ncbi:MAG: hypothetical protein HY820_25625 [Acidobacteria bacterium]|nr:hypothetical protein [Acidobacteriota bacterium]
MRRGIINIVRRKDEAADAVIQPRQALQRHAETPLRGSYEQILGVTI